MIRTRRMPVDGDLETNRFSGACRPKDQMQVTGAEAVGYAAISRIKCGRFRANRPGTGKSHSLREGVVTE